MSGNVLSCAHVVRYHSNLNWRFQLADMNQMIECYQINGDRMKMIPNSWCAHCTLNDDMETDEHHWNFILVQFFLIFCHCLLKHLVAAVCFFLFTLHTTSPDDDFINTAERRIRTLTPSHISQIRGIKCNQAVYLVPRCRPDISSKSGIFPFRQISPFARAVDSAISSCCWMSPRSMNVNTVTVLVRKCEVLLLPKYEKSRLSSLWTSHGISCKTPFISIVLSKMNTSRIKTV